LRYKEAQILIENTLEYICSAHDGMQVFSA